ncbi:MAG: tetratricopeptide repeat protein [Candidatus Amoebophilus sp.]
MRNPILEKLLPSLDILIGCMLIMYTSGCGDDLPNPTQNTNLVGQSITKALPSTTGNQTTTDNQLTLARTSLITGQKDNKRKGPEEIATLVSENGTPLSSERLVPTGELLRLEKEKASEEEETSIKNSTKRLKVTKSKLSSALQKTNKEESTQQYTPEAMDSGYSTMEAEKLAELANNNDIEAQEEIVSRCLKGTITPLLASLISPYRWEIIKERAGQDERYIYLLLRFAKQTDTVDILLALLEDIERDAVSGNALAQTNLGYMYEKHIGIAGDCDKAIKWYRAAAKQGYAMAQKLLGDMHFKGFVDYCGDKNQGCEDKKKDKYNEEKAVEWYKSSIKQGYVPALTSLGYLYQKARMIYYRLYKEAIKCYKKAAEQGDTQAKFHLGETYYYGEMTNVIHYRGVKTDYKKAFKWYSQAANEGHADAQAQLGLMYYNGQMVEHDFAKAAEWYRKAAKGGSNVAQYHMGEIYLKGIEVPKDLAQTIYWYMQARYDSGLSRILKVKEQLLSLPATVPNREIEEIESKLFRSWQAIVLQGGQSQASEYIASYVRLLRILEQLKQWRVALHTQCDLMVSCLQFVNPKDRIAIESYQKETGIVPYVKGHSLDNKEYLSFGEKNVEISEAIVSELVEKRLYKEVQDIFKQLEELGTIKQDRQVNGAVYMKDTLEGKGFISGEEKDLAKSLTRINKSGSVLLESVQLIQNQAQQFDKYYRLLLEEIEKGQYVRNEKFVEKHAYIFNPYWSEDYEHIKKLYKKII